MTEPKPAEVATEITGRKPLTPEAKRALAEADERRRQQNEPARPAEVGGRKGPDPVRFGDWETGGIVSDF